MPQVFHAYHAASEVDSAAPIALHFRPRRYRPNAAVYRETRDERFAAWRAITGVSVAP